MLCEKNCTKTIQNVYKNENTKFVYNLYTMIVQTKILYNNECTIRIHQIPKSIQKMYKLYKTCTKLRLKTA